MADSRVLLNDGTSAVLLNSGDYVLLNAGVSAGGVVISGTHATPLISRRGSVDIDVDFTFWLKSCIVARIKNIVKIVCPLLKTESSNFKVKSPLLVENHGSLKIKSTILYKILERVVIKSTHIKPIRETFLIVGITKTEKLRKALLRKLQEYLNNE